MMGFRSRIGISVGLVALSLFVVSAYAGEREDEEDNGEEKTIRFVTTNTATFMSAPFNFTSQDPRVQFRGVANYAFFSGEGELGKITGQGVSQSAPTGESCQLTLPDGSVVTAIKIALEDHVAVTRFERTGDLLFERGEPGDLEACITFEPGPFMGFFREEGTVKITGGTGRFSGARGSYDATQEGQVQVPPGSDKLQFGYATSTYRYTLTVPK
jgi:hypothetical protein